MTYEGVLKRVRQAYHALAAEWLIQQCREGVCETAGLVAEHLDLAGRHDDAREYYQQAAKEASERFALKEALDYLTRALDITPDDQLEDRFELLMRREGCLRRMGASGQQKRDLNELQLLAGRLQDDLRKASVLTRLGEYLEIISSFKEAVSITRKELALRTKIGHRAGEANALAQLGWRLLLSGENADQALPLPEKKAWLSLKILGIEGKKWWLCSCWVICMGGEHDLALSAQRFEQSLAIAKEINIYSFICWSLNNLAEKRAARWRPAFGTGQYQKSIGRSTTNGSSADPGTIFASTWHLRAHEGRICFRCY